MITFILLTITIFSDNEKIKPQGLKKLTGSYL